MGGPDQRRPALPPARGLCRGAILAWAACALVVWNVVFDANVTESGREYLTLQALHQQGKGPAVTIRSVMDPGVARAARTATASGALVGAAGCLAVWLAARPRAGGSAGGAR